MQEIQEAKQYVAGHVRQIDMRDDNNHPLYQPAKYCLDFRLAASIITTIENKQSATNERKSLHSNISLTQSLLSGNSKLPHSLQTP